jgi:DNA-directed RNA polymerase specialized sigma24 family protein
VNGKSACRIVPPGEEQELKRDWTPSQAAFRQFLDWLDEGVASDGEKYLEMRRRLVFYFDRKNCLASDELADETLGRVAQKLEEKGSITGMSPAHYCYVVAKFVFLENLRQARRGQQGLDELTQARLSSGSSLNSKDQEAKQSRERVHACLDSCLAKLCLADRELILEYYRGEQRAKIERRSALAKRLGVSNNALTIRACRIRNKLEQCVRACCQET